MVKKIEIKVNSKCLICFDTGQYFNGEFYEFCDHIDNKNAGLISDEKIQTDNLEENEDTD